MTERNTHPHNHSAQNQGGAQRRGAERRSVASARDELERERELYSAHDPRQSAASPAQRYAEAHASDGAAPAGSPGGSQPSARLPRVEGAGARQGTGSWSTGAFPADRQASQPSQRIPRISQTGSLAAVRRAGSSEAIAHSSRLTPADRLSVPAPEAADEAETANAEGDAGRGASEATSETRTRRRQTEAGRSRNAESPRPRSETRRGTTRRTRDTQAAGSAADADEATDAANAETDADAAQDQANDQPEARQPQRRPNPRKRSAAQGSRPSASQRGGSGSGRPPRNPASSYNADRYRALEAARPTPQDSLRKAVIAAVVIVALVVVGVFGFQSWAAAQPVDVTINGEQKTIEGNQRSLEGLLDEGVVSVTPGNYVAVDGSTLREGEGTRCTASVNGEQTDDLTTHLNAGDTIDISDGTDVMEEYTDGEPQTIPHGVKMQGVGAVHLYLDGAEDGEKVERTGSESGITTEVTTKEPVDRIVQYYNVDSGDDKVVALTFDDGPWDSSTEEILDILKENDAKATFFTVGQKISGREDLLKRAVDEGHEIGTHTWDHAEGSGQGVSLIMMSSDERKQEVEKGLQAITDATGQDASTIFRAPGGNFDESAAADLDGIVTAEIGWNIDTQDWQKPGTDTIVQRIESADPGEIILMHDGGGDRSETVAALREALPKLKEEGFSFITVQELIERYPYQAEDDQSSE